MEKSPKFIENSLSFTQNSPSIIQNSLSTKSRPVCVFCDTTFSSLSSLSNHKRRCKEKQNSIIISKKDLDLRDKIESGLKSENKKLKAEIKELKIENKELIKKLLDELKEDKDKFADLAATNGATAHKSVSDLTYIMNNYSNAPALEQIDDLSILKIKFNDDTKFILHLLSAYQNEIIADYLGEFIVGNLL